MITKNRIKTVLMAIAITALAAGPALADLAAGLTLDFNASDPASGVDSSNWNSLVSPGTRDLDFGADVTLEDVSTIHKITKAYHFTGGTADNSQGHWGGYNENEDASWEFWLKPSDTGTLDASQTLFESGGNGDGISFWYQPGNIGDNLGTVNFTIDNGGNQSTVRAVIDTTEFSNIACVYDRDFDGTIDLMQIYVNGVLVDDNISATTDDDPANDTNPTSIHDWTGTNNGGLGNDNGNIAETAAGGQYDGYMAVFRFWELKALTAAEVEENFKVLGVSDPLNPNPPDGAEVSASSSLVLSWTNLPPADANDGSVWVDVYFGTDPNDTTGVTFAKIIDAGENVNTVTVDASVIGRTYYWKIDLYLGGSPTGDPNEGKIYSFLATDLLPSLVEINTPDTVTWSGEPVQLDATVEDDGLSALTYAWSANTEDGIIAAFSADDIEDPTVTFTKVPYSTAKIVNAGFEDVLVADGAWSWLSSWSWIGQGGSSGSWNPGATSGSIGYGGNAPEGVNIAWVGLDPGDPQAGLAQVLNEKLATNTTYVLTVEVGDSPLYDWPGYNVQLLAGGTVLAEDLNTIAVADNTFETSTVMFDSTGVDPALVGQPLEIRLIALAAPGVNWAELNFDNVQLTADPPFPALTGVQTVELTLAVSDGGNPVPVDETTDTVLIEVYDDACKAALGEGLATIDMTDHDSNCITNLADFAEMALTWLYDYTLLEPTAIVP